MVYTPEFFKRIKESIQNKDYLAYMNFVAEYHGGELISKEYISYDYPYEFNFIKGDNSTRFTRRITCLLPHKTNGLKYIWPQSMENIIRKNESKDDKFVTFKNKVESLGGVLVDTEWKGCSVRHEIQLYNETLFLSPKEVTRSGLATPSRGQVTEPILKQCLEHLFGYSFNKTRQVLTTDITNTKSNLELDGYCEELKIAFEYQGHPSHWNKEHERYELTKKHDKLKIALCKKLGITLLVFEKITHKKHSDSEYYFNLVLNNIHKQFSLEKRKLPNMNTKSFKIDLSKTNHYHQSLNNLIEKANENGYQLLDNEWKGPNHLYAFLHIESGIELKFTSLCVNNTSRGLPKDINKYLEIINQKDKQFQLKKFKTIIEENGFVMVDEKWLGGQQLHQIKHTITHDIIEIKPSNVFYSKSKNYVKNKFDDLLKNRNMSISESNNKVKIKV